MHITVDTAISNYVTMDELREQVTACWNGDKSSDISPTSRQLVSLVLSKHPMTLDQVLSALNGMYEAATHIREAKRSLSAVRMNKSQTPLRVKEMKEWFDIEWNFSAKSSRNNPSSPILYDGDDDQ